MEVDIGIKMNKRAEELINILELSPHPEGGYYKEVYRSKSELSSPKNNKVRNAVTDIYFLLVSGQISRFHKVIHDEIWNFYEGAPLELIEIEPDTLEIDRNVAIPAETMRAVEALVGPEQAAEFITLAAEREVRARSLDRLTANHSPSGDLDETP